MFYRRRYQEILAVNLPLWFKEGAYLYMLHHLGLSFRPSDPTYTKAQLPVVGLDLSEIPLAEILEALQVGIEGLDDAVYMRINHPLLCRDDLDSMSDSEIASLYANRYIKIVNSLASDWMKRGAYLNLLRKLPLDTNNSFESQRRLAAVGVAHDPDRVRKLLEEMVQGIDHVDKILVKYSMAQQWETEDRFWL